jgi:hypothetical protein
MTVSLRLAVVAAVLGVVARPAAAQPLDRPYAMALGPVALGGEISAVFGPTDDTAFFNYTDYELNALRTARLRVAAEWRVRPTLALLGEVRADNFADVDASGFYVRWQPWADRPLAIQAGRVPPVFGAFPRRAYGRDNPMPGAPLVYQYLTSLRPDALPETTADLLRMRGRGWRPSYPIGAATIGTGVPLVNAIRWDTGAQASWQAPRWALFGALTRGAPAVPVLRETNDGLQLSGRAAVHVWRGATVGISAARGPWIDNDARRLLPAGASNAGSQRVWGIDGEHGEGQWLVRGEWIHSAFDVPLGTPQAAGMTLSANGGFGEVRYRPTARWQLAARAGWLAFGSLTSGEAWDHPVQRIEGTVGYRATRHLDVRGGYQHNWRRDGRATRRGYPTLQLLYWF